MKKLNLFITTALLLFSISCTRSASKSEAASKSLKDCTFDILVFSSYNDENGKMTYDYEELEMWTREGTHDYAIKNNKQVKSASLEVLKDGKVLKTISFSLEKAGPQLTHLNEGGKVTEQLRSMGELKAKTSLRFLITTKDKKTCKKDIGVFVE